MKKLVLFIFLSLSCIQLYSQSIAPSDDRNKKIERKLAFIESKYQAGEYEEVLHHSEALIARSKKHSIKWGAYLVKAKTEQAHAYYAILKFDDAKKAYQDAVNLCEQDANVESKLIGFLILADYMAETGNIVTSNQLLNKAESLLKSPVSLKTNSEFEFVKAKLLILEGYFYEPLKIIDKQLPYRLEMASSHTPSTENSLALDSKIDFVLRKEKYAKLLYLKIASLIDNGSYEQAGTQIANTKSWIAANLGQSHILYRELLECEAKISKGKRDYDKASTLYSDAYLSTLHPEYELNKINNLSELIVASLYAGQTIKSKNYLRRLEMQASRRVGFIDQFQLAYEYTESYKSFLEGDFTSANSRLNRLKENFNFLPHSHPEYMEIVELKGLIALKRGDTKTYKETLLELSDIKKESYGENSPAYHKAQLAIAMFEIHFGKDFSMAERILNKSYNSIVKKEIIRESNQNVLYLSAYADFYNKTDRYDSAMAKAKEASDISKSLYQEKSSEYLVRFSVYIENQVTSGKYKEGFDNLQIAYDLTGSINAKAGNEEHLQNAYMILAKLYSLKGDFDRSQALLNKAYKLTYEGFERQALAEAETSEQMASLYLQTGNYFKAEKALMKSLEIKEDKLEKDSPLLIHTYQELARLNLVNGNYTLCEQYLKKAMGISAETFGKKSLVFVECQLIYAEFHQAIGDFKKAEGECKNADEIEVFILGKKNLKRAETLAKLAFIRSKMPSYKSEEVEKLYNEAAEIIKSSLGSDNPLYANLIQKQAEFYISIGKPDKADLLLTTAEKFWISKLGSDNRYVAEIILLRGNIAYSKSQYEQAEKLYSKARSLYASIFDENHPLYIQASGKLARVYYMQKHPEKSLDVENEIIPKYLSYVNKYFPSLSFKEKKKFWNQIREELDFYNFIAVCVYQKEKPKLAGGVYDNTISTKALLLNSDIKVRKSITNSNDSILINYYNEWTAQKEYLTRVIALTKQQLTEQNIDTKAIESRIDELEKEMNKRSEVFSKENAKQHLSWKDIKGTLKENEYAVEILRCRYFDKTFTDSVVYAALIINNKTSDYPEVVILPNGNLLEKKYFKYYRNASIQKIKDERSYNAYWKPIKSKIPDGATVFLSPEGVYNQVNVEMMLSASGDFVIDQNQIVALTNTKDLLIESLPKNKKSAKELKKDLAASYVLCGNPNFYSGESKLKNESLVPLPGAEKELMDINKLLTSSGKTTISLLRHTITEDTLRYLKNPKVFHIATHGFFSEPTGTEDDDLTANPLLNSGLILYGGGDIVDHPENNYVNSKEGILTAYEAINLQFDNTELVVLSACETGRGEVQMGDGVSGLQRSFLISGADAVIMSLFKVNDEVTQKLMLTFYEKWLKTGNKRKAFADAKKEIKKEYQSPIYWGVFVMIEGKPQTPVAP